MQVFLFPFAGANLNSYRTITGYFPKNWEIYALELPGRGARYHEPLLRNMGEAVLDITAQFRRKRKYSEPWLVLAHSMGCTLFFEMMKKQYEFGITDLPERAVLSGRAAPGTAHHPVIRHRLTDEHLFDNLYALGGLADDVFHSPELRALAAPVLKADFEMVEVFDEEEFGTKPYLKNPYRMAFPVHILNGSSDSIKGHQITEWEKFCGKEITFTELEGNHFFMFRHAQIISDTLAKATA
ncbi:MAG: hypothetical protein LAT67_00450 [Balneolales bacterium]|nr:hypothetical protein [Balneolales bacterium]